MIVVSDLYDNRIKSHNLLVEITIGDYIGIANDILHKNEFQRKRVRSSKSVYSLLRTDLEKGCVIPPIVLALTAELDGEVDVSQFSDFINENKDHLVILDGLQRTYTIIDLVDNLTARGDEETLTRVLEHKIRAEFYTGINRLGILYRMLTLNTGQTPMSLRQQIEILYLDYLGVADGAIELIREAEGRMATQQNQYKFRDVVEGFNSYLDRNELPIDRADLLENISSLEKLANENAETDLFEGYLTTLHHFNMHMNVLCDGVELDLEESDLSSAFGKTALQIFKKPQSMSGFGAAIGKLRDFDLVSGFDQVCVETDNIRIDSAINFLERINRALEWLKNNTKKIGNAQRSYFHYFYRDLYNKENESYLNAELAAESALKKYQSQNI